MVIDLTFTSTTSNFSIDVMVIDDGSFEGDELFQATLTIITAGALADVRPAVADITILDDDGVYLCLWLSLQ